MRVLIVDDNVDAADTMAMLLQLKGHATRVEYSARAAWLASFDFEPDAIFCDIGLPDMNGHELATQLRNDPRFASTLLIAVSGWSAEESRCRSRGAAFDHHLTKPADFGRVEAILSRPAVPSKANASRL